MANIPQIEYTNRTPLRVIKPEGRDFSLQGGAESAPVRFFDTLFRGASEIALRVHEADAQVKLDTAQLVVKEEFGRLNEELREMHPDLWAKTVADRKTKIYEAASANITDVNYKRRFSGWYNDRFEDYRLQTDDKRWVATAQLAKARAVDNIDKSVRMGDWEAASQLIATGLATGVFTPAEAFTLGREKKVEHDLLLMKKDLSSLSSFSAAEKALADHPLAPGIPEKLREDLKKDLKIEYAARVAEKQKAVTHAINNLDVAYYKLYSENKLTPSQVRGRAAIWMQDSDTSSLAAKHIEMWERMLMQGQGKAGPGDPNEGGDPELVNEFFRDQMNQFMSDEEFRNKWNGRFGLSTEGAPQLPISMRKQLFDKRHVNPVLTDAFDRIDKLYKPAVDKEKDSAKRDAIFKAWNDDIAAFRESLKLIPLRGDPEKDLKAMETLVTENADRIIRKWVFKAFTEPDTQLTRWGLTGFEENIKNLQEGRAKYVMHAYPQEIEKVSSGIRLTLEKVFKTKLHPNAPESRRFLADGRAAFLVDGYWYTLGFEEDTKDLFVLRHNGEKDSWERFHVKQEKKKSTATIPGSTSEQLRALQRDLQSKDQKQ